MEQIIITHVYPPIPSRRFDWSAHVKGTEDIGMVIGYGPNIPAAIDDLIESWLCHYDGKPEADEILNYKWIGQGNRCVHGYTGPNNRCVCWESRTYGCDE